MRRADAALARSTIRGSSRSIAARTRDRWAGSTPDGDGDWAIALRCAALDGERATLYAGAGIVAGSDPAREVDETDRKFRAFLDSLRWG